MLALKIVFGIIVTLPILLLAEYLFENTVADAVIGTSKKKKKPLLQRLFPWAGKRRKRKMQDNEDNKEDKEDKEGINS